MHFMHMHTFDAKEAMLNPFQAHQHSSRNHLRNSGMPPHHQNHHLSQQQQQSRNGDYLGLSHDPMTAINSFDHDRHQSSLSNLPIPVGKSYNFNPILHGRAF